MFCVSLDPEGERNRSRQHFLGRRSPEWSLTVLQPFLQPRDSHVLPVLGEWWVAKGVWLFWCFGCAVTVSECPRLLSQVCQWLHVPALAVHPPHDVHPVPPGQPAAHRPGGWQLLLPVWPESVLHLQGTEHGHSWRSQVWAPCQRHQSSVSVWFRREMSGYLG